MIQLLRALAAPPPVTLQSLVRAYYRLMIMALTLFFVVHGWPGRTFWLAFAIWEGADWWRLRQGLSPAERRPR